MMFTREELNAKKYGDLLKILKKFGVKGGRQKTQCVIELIIENQNSERKEQLVKSNPPLKENCSARRNNLPSDPSNKKMNTEKTLRGEDTVHQVKVKAEENQPIAGTSINSLSTSHSSFMLRSIQSTTFIKDESTACIPSPVNGHITRSTTFTVDDQEKDQGSNSKKFSQMGMSEAVDLSCGEIQTAEDIQLLESSAKRSVDSHISPSVKGRRLIRRSLRGQLLETKALRTQESMLMLFHPNKSDMSPKSMDEKEMQNEVSLKKKQCPSLPKTHNIDANEKASAIPRFVSFALKMPNFSRIHEIAFHKMEALDDYVERKRTRIRSAGGTAITTSEDGETTGPSLSKLSTPVITSKAERAETRKKSDQESKTPKRSVLLLSRKSSTFETSKMIDAKRNDPNSVSSSRKATNPPKPSALPRLIKENVPPGKTPSNSWNKVQVDSNIPGSLQRRKEYSPHPQKVRMNCNATMRTEVTEMNLRKRSGNDRKTDRREMIKNLVKKQPKIRSRAEMRAAEKVFIKGVRTNRRFELQMANRGIQF